MPVETRVEIKGVYKGDLRVELTHGPSSTIIQTDAPKDNQGQGARFSPTDLVVSALASCMMTIMGIVARRDSIKLEGVTFKAQKYMYQDPRRIGKIAIEFYMPKDLTEEQKKKLEKFASTCPVHQSLKEDIEQDIKFIYS